MRQVKAPLQAMKCCENTSTRNTHRNKNERKIHVKKINSQKKKEYIKQDNCSLEIINIGK